MNIRTSEQVSAILNKIATFERSKRLNEQQKTMLIQPLTAEIERLTGQTQLGLEGGSQASQAPTKAAK